MSQLLSERPRSFLVPGLKIGQYTIVSLIGAGGMGEVYRARDERLDREVALKILPTDCGADPERIARFELEARATGKLSHPNVVSIFDTGTYEGRPYLVTELLDGESLRSHLQSRGPLPIRKVIDLATQIARGLAAAHEKGIIHRDLKPANIHISNDGHAKILDFGLAKLTQAAWEREAPDGDTISGLTTPGRILGSVGYMSPEQVEAREVDARSDVFAFGAILYEMTTGVRAFSGSSLAGTISAVLHAEPKEAATIRSETPPGIAVIIRRCLEKNPEDRFQSARDLAFSLQELISTSDISLSRSALAAVRGMTARIQPRRAAGVGIALVAIAVLVIVLITNDRTTAGVGSPTKTRAPHFERLTSSGRVGGLVALSSDLKYLVTVEQDQGTSTLSLMHVPTRSTTSLTTGSYFGTAAFSPDGNHIYFTRSGPDEVYDLYRIALLGGQPQRIAQSVAAEGLIGLSHEGSHVAYLRGSDDRDSTIFIAASDGTAERPVASRKSDARFDNCSWAPDGARFLCSAVQARKVVMVEVTATTGAQRLRPELRELYDTAWTADGTAVIGVTPYIEGSQIVRMDVRSGELSAITSDPGGYGPISLSRSGNALAAVRLDSRINLWTMAVDDPRSLRQITSGTNTQDGNFGITVAPDGRIVWSSKASGKGIDLWISNSDGSGPRRLTLDDEAAEKWPVVSPDGRHVAYLRETTSGETGARDIYRIDIEAGRVEQLTRTGDVRAPRYTSDGQSLLFSRILDGQDYSFEMPADGGIPRQIDPNPALGPVPSPDGKWILVSAPNAGGLQLELRPFKQAGQARKFPARAQIKKWRPDGRAFGFIQGGRNLWIQELTAAKPRQITNFSGWDFTMSFEWSRDGKHVLLSRRTDTRDIVLIQPVQ